MKKTVILAFLLSSALLISCGPANEQIPEQTQIETGTTETIAETEDAPEEESTGSVQETLETTESETESNTEQEQTETSETTAGTETAAESETQGDRTEADMDALVSLIGMDDATAAEALGGGEENWTEDKNFFIGRIYEVTLFGEDVSVYTSYDDQEKVNSVSVWIVDGSRTVEKEEAETWKQRLDEYTGTEAVFDGVTSEGGSDNWKWKSGNNFITLNWMKEILTISINPAVGELH